MKTKLRDLVHKEPRKVCRTTSAPQASVSFVAKLAAHSRTPTSLESWCVFQSIPREEQSFVAKLAAHSRTPSSRSADTKRVPSGPFHELPNPVSPWLVKSSLSRRPRRGSLLDNRTQYSLFRGIQRVRGQLLPVRGVWARYDLWNSLYGVHSWFPPLIPTEGVATHDRG